LETSNEELKSTNEELQSANEELQSTNEELETAKEEQQSVNEELVTVNSELQQKIEQLSRVNDDMNNLMASTQVGTIFLDMSLEIQRFTPAATEVINLIQTDVGRPLAHIVSKLDYDSIEQDARKVLKTLVPKTVEVKTKEDRWYLMRLQPYRTTDNRIDGVVLTFSEITQQKQVQANLAARIMSENIINVSNEAFLILDNDLRVLLANYSFYSMFSVSPERTIGQRLYDLGNGQWDIPELRKLLHELVPTQKEVTGFRVWHDFESIGKRKMLLNAKQFRSQGDDSDLIILAIKDETEKGSSNDQGENK
jgi:two-component system, chemotaxis family, CheB/CheR fusion protein